MTTTQTAQAIGISADELTRLADHSEQRARELIARGIPEAQAIQQATDETIELARTLGLI